MHCCNINKSRRGDFFGSPGMLTCAQKLTSSQLKLPHRKKQKRVIKKLKTKKQFCFPSEHIITDRMHAGHMSVGYLDYSLNLELEMHLSVNLVNVYSKLENVYTHYGGQ